MIAHPLAKYPGPFLAKLTDVYAAYHAWKGDLHLEIWRLHQKHGMCTRENFFVFSEPSADIFCPGKYIRLGPDILIVDSVAAVEGLYRFHNF